MKKNIAGQKWRVFAFNRLTGSPVTGDAANITAKLSKDFGAAVAVTDTNPTEAEDGYYWFDLSQTETNADNLHLFPESVTSNVQVIGDPGSFSIPSSLGASTDTQTTIIRSLLESVPIRFTHPVASATMTTSTHRINDGSAVTNTGSVTFLFSSGTEHWYQLAYHANDRPSLPGTVNYLFSDGTYTTTVAVYFSNNVSNVTSTVATGSATIDLIVGDTSSRTITCVDDSGNDIAITGLTLELIVEDPGGVDVIVIAAGSISIANGNEATFSPTSAMVLVPRTWEYSLRQVSNGRKIMHGLMPVEYAATNDP